MTPASRTTDPLSSHLAEQEVTESGARAIQCRKVYSALRRAPGSTSAELAKAFDIDRHCVARRLPDLADSGYITRSDQRKCMVTGRLSLTWELRHDYSTKEKAA